MTNDAGPNFDVAIFENSFDEIEEAVAVFSPTLRAERVRYRYLCRTLSSLGHGLTLLDVGCGRGVLCILLSRLGWLCEGVDDLNDYRVCYDQAEVEKVRAIDESLRSAASVRLHCQDLFSTLPFEAGKFDVVSCTDVMEHLHRSPRPLLAEIGRVLKPGGWCLMATPNSVNLRKRINVVLGRTNLPALSDFFYSEGEWRGHVREPTLSELRTMAVWAGLELVRVGSVPRDLTASGLVRDPARRLASRLWEALGRILPTLAGEIMVLARKPT